MVPYLPYLNLRKPAGPTRERDTDPTEGESIFHTTACIGPLISSVLLQSNLDLVRFDPNQKPSPMQASDNGKPEKIFVLYWSSFGTFLSRFTRMLSPSHNYRLVSSRSRRLP